jgi:hypothetical protein
VTKTNGQKEATQGKLRLCEERKTKILNNLGEMREESKGVIRNAKYYLKGEKYQ